MVRKRLGRMQWVSFGLSFVFSLFIMKIVHAENPVVYQPLVGLPQIAGSGRGLAAYLNQLYIVSIAFGAILAFVQISVAGVKYSLDEIVTHKSEAKDDIRKALLGLGILLIPYIVLNTIYPGLTNLNILQNAQGLRITQQQTTSSVAPVTTTTNTPGSATSPTTSTVYRNCSYDRTLVNTVTNGLEAPGAQYTYDSTRCRAACDAVNGDFTETGIDTSRCAFIEVAPPSTAACATGGPCI